MPVYNAEPYLGKAIHSILKQTFKDFELIIIDDGSVDRSKSIAEEFRRMDNRIQLHSQPNSGIVAALNLGLQVARANVIARMDGDDACLAERFDLQYRFLLTHSSCVAVSSQIITMDSDGEPIGKVEQPLDHSSINRQLMSAVSGAFIHAAMMARKEPIMRIGGYREQYKTVEDFDLLLRLAEIGELANLPQCLYYYRQHVNATCYTNRLKQQELKRDIIREACQRRGVDPSGLTYSGIHRENVTRLNVHLGWAGEALASGYRATARKHSILAIRENPLFWNGWRLFILSFVGSDFRRKLRNIKHKLHGLNNA